MTLHSFGVPCESFSQYVDVQKVFETIRRDQFTAYPCPLDELKQADVEIVAERPIDEPQGSSCFPFSVTGVYHEKTFFH